jgi:putative ABC transport system permease protein
LDSLAGDLRAALRLFRRSPGFALAVVLTLGVGIGSATAVFTFVNGVLLSPLPYPASQRLIEVCEIGPDRPDAPCVVSPADWADWSSKVRSLDHFGLARDWTFGVREGDRRHMISGGIATPALFETFGVHPALGRLFEPRDLEPGSAPVAILSHEFWRTRFGGRLDILDRSLEIDGHARRIVGVLPSGFSVPRLQEAALWIPLWPERLSSRGWRGFKCYGRLAKGVDLTAARAEIRSIATDLSRIYPETNAGWDVSVDSLRERTVRGVRPALLIFQAAVLLVLLIACANAAHLLLARGASREREFAVRRALGAGGGRLACHLLVEGATLALGGGVVGVLGARWAVDMIAAFAPDWVPRLEEVHFDARVLTFGLVITLGSSLLFGLVPALQASRVDLSRSLRDSGSAGRPGAVKAREFLVITETALACVLLVSAGLLVRSFGNLLDWKPGFDPRNLVVVPLFSSPGKYASAAPVVDLYRRGVEEIASLPFVVSAGAGSAVPLFGGDGSQEFALEGRDEPPGRRPVAFWYDVDPDYFRTLGIPLLRGRLLAAFDGRGAPSVAVINETMARRVFAEENPIGRSLRTKDRNDSLEIVGVVGDVRPFRPDEAPKPEIYWPSAQAPRYAILLIARTTGPPAASLPAIRARLEALDPDMELGTIRTMDQLIAGQLVNPRFHSMIGGALALAALLMAIVGTYGVASLSVVQRTREIGVRMALGARPRSILGMVLGRSLALTAMGLALGLAAAFASMRLMTALLVGVAPVDPATLASVAILFTLVVLAACGLPARRATRVDPMVALRHE